ncbi:DUF3857 domain-containing transglutaminase family protein [Tenacibaculum geojense]|uniref:DUF3857 domain-containing transglutaminase family protein n=1 Tax=Tenacibaculum geojense TaxID=915352 RepID=A0ABW3JSM8_9FLAO
MKKHYLLLFFISLVYSLSFAQEIDYNFASIPDSLKINANSIVRNHLLEINIISSRKLSVHKKLAVTVLNESGKNDALMYQHYNNDTKIKKLSIKIYDQNGKQIEKFNENKFTDVSAVDGVSIYTDAKLKYVEYTPTAYPYTVEFESDTENNTTVFIPEWTPVRQYEQSVQKSAFIINNPQQIPYRKKEVNFNNYTIENQTNDQQIKYILKNQKALKQESVSLPYFKILPAVKVALNNFSLKGVSGSAKNWKEFGLWMNEKLLNGKNQLDPTVVAEVNSLVKNAKNDEEKARIIYQYVQDRTRYISVQIGIGGWTPTPANEVHKLGYGDCKGLTNYTHALLKAVGVTSYYTIVYADTKRDIDENFTSMQGNHAILNIPNNGNDIWLECTSQTIPFGFLGDFTHDRNVLVVTPNGGIIKKTPSYLNKTNIQTTKANVTVNSKGSITADFERESRGTQYDQKKYTTSYSEEELIKHYKSNVWDYNNNLEPKNISINNDKEKVVLTEKIAVNISEYATITDSEMLLRLNIFNKFSYIPKRYRNKKHDFRVSGGFLDKDEYTIKIPNEYTINSLPTPKSITSKFGEYIISVEKIDANTLLYKKHFLLKAGEYLKTDYKAYRNFLKKISKYENSRIALSKSI